MSTALGKFLIFNVATGRACLFQFTNRAGDLLRATGPVSASTIAGIVTALATYPASQMTSVIDSNPLSRRPAVAFAIPAPLMYTASKPARSTCRAIAAFGTPGSITGPVAISSRSLLLLLMLRHSFFGISSAFTSSSTFLASSSFQTRSTIFRACSLPIAGSTSAKNFSSTSESFSRFFACPIG